MTFPGSISFFFPLLSSNWDFLLFGMQDWDPLWFFFSFQWYSIFSFWDWPPPNLTPGWSQSFWGERNECKCGNPFVTGGDLKARGFPSLPFCTWSPFVSPLLDASWVARWGLRASNPLSLSLSLASLASLVVGAVVVSSLSNGNS